MRTIQAISTRLGLSSSHTASFDATIEPTNGALPVPRPDEPNVYNLPPQLRPTYGSLPLLAKLMVGALCSWIAAVTSFETKSALWVRQLVAAAHQQQVNARTVVLFLVKAVGLFVMTNLVLQDVFTRPSRITIQNLMDRYFLPSPLSKYETVNVRPDVDIGVHSLRYHNTDISTDEKRNQRYSTLYLNHGFGASSLSWLPVIPKLANRLRVKTTVGHDAPGFGYTDRPRDVNLYSPSASCDIGLSLLQQDENEEPDHDIILMGHSMGSFATLEMATKLPPEQAVTVVLVAPALGMRRGTIRPQQEPSNGKIADVIQDYVVGPPIRYILKRVVGTKGFWKRGLQGVWGNASLVSDSDALRFQWPSVGAGWEQGLLRFTRAMTSFPDAGGADLLERVARRKNTKILVILGQNDPVISRKTIERVFEKYPNVPIVEVAGCGHDPFEEQVDDFVDTVEKLLSESGEKN